MKFLPISLVVTVLLFSIACNNRGSADRKQAADSSSHSDTTQNNPSFPVGEWIQSEISYVDSFPPAIIEYITKNNHRDSVFLSPAEFNRIAAGNFLLPELVPSFWQKNYSENSFFDKTTGYLTFTYSSRDTTLSLHRVDVMIKQAGGINQVKSAYFETYANRGDTLVVKKMFWNSKHDFQVITSLRIQGQPELQEQLHMVWDAE